MPRMSQPDQRKATREKLIDAALRLFSRNGYEYATVDDISQEAGYSKGAYYFHFSTKDDVLLELLRAWTEDRTAVLTAAAASHDAARDTAREMLRALYSYDVKAGWPSLLLEFWSQSMRNAEVEKRLTQAYTGWRRQLTEALAAAAGDGSLRLGSPQEVASLALAAHDGYAVQLTIGFPGAKALTPSQMAEALIAPLEAAAAAEPQRRAVAQ